MPVATSTKSNIDAAMQNLFASFGAAWDKHDARAMASLFTEDGDVINPAGRVAVGEQEIEKLFHDEHSSRFKASRMRMTVSRVRVLTPDIAIVTNNVEVSGVNDPSADGRRAVQIIATFVVRNEHDSWRIVSARPMVPAVPPDRT